MTTTATEGPTYFLLDQVPWPDENLAGSPGNVPRELVEKAASTGARRKFLARGEGGFHSQYSEFPAGFAIPPHSHDHDEMIVLVDGSFTMLKGGPTLRARDSVVLRAGYEYGFTAGGDGMSFLTIRTGVASVQLAESNDA
jgi:quercetin dioxygenase-like cupin family protein